MTVHRNQIESTSGTRNPDGTFSLFETVTVNGLETVGASKILEALDLAEAQIGTPHPEVTNMELRNATASVVTGDVIQLRMEYRQRQFAAFSTVQDEIQSRLQVGSTLSQEQVNTDVNGKLLIVSYNLKDENGDSTGVRKQQTGTVAVLLPQSTITVNREELESPLDKSRRFTGKANNGGWLLDPAATARTWLCTGITGNTQDNGDTWDVTYSFQFDRDIWDATIVFRDETGQVPGDVEEKKLGGGGISTYQMYKTVDFNSILA